MAENVGAKAGGADAGRVWCLELNLCQRELPRNVDTTTEAAALIDHEFE